MTGDDRDPLAPAAGVALGVVIGAAVWLVGAALAVLAWRWWN